MSLIARMGALKAKYLQNAMTKKNKNKDEASLYVKMFRLHVMQAYVMAHLTYVPIDDFTFIQERRLKFETDVWRCLISNNLRISFHTVSRFVMGSYSPSE